jgi:hypothetical protein
VLQAQARRYKRHCPQQTLLYRLVEQHYPAFVAALAGEGREAPGCVAREFAEYLKCGRLDHGAGRGPCVGWWKSGLADAQESRSEPRPKPDSGGGKTSGRPTGGCGPLARVAREGGKWALPCGPTGLCDLYAPYERQRMRLVPLQDDGTANVDALNVEFSPEYLADARNPRWVAKATVAYLWARTVTCNNCRATVPLLKTR